MGHHLRNPVVHLELHTPNLGRACALLVQPSQRGVLTNATQVWGVAYDRSAGLVYASDMNSGLWIVRRTD
jgi:hypothetical protein